MAPPRRDITDDDDWTLHKDPAKRRKLQNRDAQRRRRGRVRSENSGQLNSQAASTADKGEDKAAQAGGSSSVGANTLLATSPWLSSVATRPDNMRPVAAVDTASANRHGPNTSSADSTTLDHMSLIGSPSNDSFSFQGQYVPIEAGASNTQLPMSSRYSSTQAQPSLAATDRIANFTNPLQQLDALDDAPMPFPAGIAPELQSHQGNAVSHISSDPTVPSNPPSSSSRTNESQSSSSIAEQSMTARLEYVMRCTRTAGFENLDEVFLRYYSEDLDDAPALRTAQRKSRRSGLRSLVPELLTKSLTWSTWEASGYQDEVMRAAHTLMVRETQLLSAKLQSPSGQTSFREHVGLEAALNGERVSRDQKRALFEEAPNLWSFLEDVARCFGAEDDDHSDHVLESVAVLTAAL